MAQAATIFKVELHIADMDRGYYADHHLTVARHPSETDERMMVRLLAFALHAGERLAFTRGLSSEDDEPDLWQKSLTDEVEVWVDVGLPDERRLRKASRKAEQVYIYAYGGRGVTSWWQKTAAAARDFDNLHITNLPYEATQALAQLVARSMELQCTIQEGQVWLGNGEHTVFIEPETLK
jgi:uncharacterized protein YaeQ